VSKDRLKTCYSYASECEFIFARALNLDILQQDITWRISTDYIFPPEVIQPNRLRPISISPPENGIVPEFCTRDRNEALKPFYLKRSWINLDPQAYYRYGEDQNCETSFKDKGLQAVVDSWCKIQVVTC